MRGFRFCATPLSTQPRHNHNLYRLSPLHTLAEQPLPAYTTWLSHCRASTEPPFIPYSTARPRDRPWTPRRSGPRAANPSKNRPQHPWLEISPNMPLSLASEASRPPRALEQTNRCCRPPPQARPSAPTVRRNAGCEHPPFLGLDTRDVTDPVLVAGGGQNFCGFWAGSTNCCWARRGRRCTGTPASCPSSPP